MYLEHLAVTAFDHSEVNTPVYALDAIRPCEDSECVSIGFGFTNQSRPWSDYVIQHISQAAKVRLGSEARIYTYEDPMAFIGFLANSTHSTTVGVLFCTGTFDVPPNPYLQHLNCSPIATLDSYVYSVFINTTSVLNTYMTKIDDPVTIDRNALAIKVAVDNAIMSYKSRQMGYPEVHIEVEMQDFPHTASRFLEGYDVISIEGAFWYFIPPMVTFIIMLTELVREKEHKLRIGLTVMGMRGRAYWLSWFFIGISLIFLSTNVLIFTGYLLSFDFFLKTPYLILLMLFFGFGMSMMLLAFCLSTVISSLKTAYTISYAFLLLGLVLQLFMINVVLLYLLYLEIIPWWIRIIVFLLPLYPPFNFSKAFGDIARRSARHFSGGQSMWSK